MTKRLEALRKSQKEGGLMEFSWNDNPKCPHCGESHEIGDNDWYSLHEEGEHDVTCPDCGLDFTVSTSVSYSFTTERQRAV